VKEQEIYELMKQDTYYLEKVLQSNSYTRQFGLQLSEHEVLELLQDRKCSLQEQERVEFGEGILQKIIFAFCDSPYIYQDNYVDMIAQLQNIFYLYKNESMDELTDDELLSYMKEKFENECQGSVEHLEDTCLEGFARMIRAGTCRFMGANNEWSEE